MSAALTVEQPRHLALPECALFAPCELNISAACTPDEFRRIGAALVALDTADELWTCDLSQYAITRWGAEDGLKLAHEATKLSVAYLKRRARIAERFDPSRRFPNMTAEHYRGLCCFPVEFTDVWLPTVAGKGFSAKTLRALCVEAYGSDPKGGYSKNKKRSVSIPETLYARFKELSPAPKVCVFIEQVLTDWADNATPETQARVAAALLTREETQHQRHMAERNAKKAEKREAKEKLRAQREAEALARKEEIAAFKEAERARLAATKEAERAAAKKAVAHCAKIAQFTERQGKKSQFATQAEADEVIKNAPHLESYACDCGQFHIRRAVGTARNGVPPSDDTSPSSQTGAPTETLPTWNWGHVQRASAPAWDSSDEGPNRLPYDQRRAAQIADGAEPIKKKRPAVAER
jgi:hypothetical protein